MKCIVGDLKSLNPFKVEKCYTPCTGYSIPVKVQTTDDGTRIASVDYSRMSFVDKAILNSRIKTNNILAQA